MRMGHNQRVGNEGERFAVEYLTQNRYAILRTHYTCHWGELDIIAEKNQTIVFVEVKTRIGAKAGKAYENVHYYKIRHLYRAMNQYVKQFHLYQHALRFDVITVNLHTNLSINSLQHYENIQLP